MGFEACWGQSVGSSARFIAGQRAFRVFSVDGRLLCLDAFAPRTSHCVAIPPPGIHRFTGFSLFMGTPFYSDPHLCFAQSYWLGFYGVSLLGQHCGIGCLSSGFASGFRGCFWQWRGLYTGAEAGRHRASQCDRVVFSPRLHSRHLIVGRRRFHLAIANGLADLSGYWLFHPARASRSD